MRRWLVLAALCLCMGAILNVLICWTGAMQVSRPFGPAASWQHEVQSPSGALYISDLESTGRLREIHTLFLFSRSAQGESPFLASTIPVPESTLAGLSSDCVRTVHVHGWPCWSMWGARETQSRVRPLHFHSPPVQPPSARHLWCSFPVAQPSSGRGIEGRLPIGILWPGFIVNTTIFAAIAWVLLLAAALQRQRRRRLARACPACGYDLRGLPQPALCPECGGPEK